jgi:seryl-tRNA synthetase
VAFCGGLAKVLNDFNSHSNINHWRAKAMNSFKNVVEKIKALDSERRNLLLEIEELKKMADSKAKALENEVGMLREEVKSLRVLLSSDQPEPEFEPKKKQFKK